MKIFTVYYWRLGEPEIPVFELDHVAPNEEEAKTDVLMLYPDAIILHVEPR